LKVFFVLSFYYLEFLLLITNKTIFPLFFPATRKLLSCPGIQAKQCSFIMIYSPSWIFRIEKIFTFIQQVWVRGIRQTISNIQSFETLRSRRCTKYCLFTLSLVLVMFVQHQWGRFYRTFFPSFSNLHWWAWVFITYRKK